MYGCVQPVMGDIPYGVLILLHRLKQVPSVGIEPTTLGLLDPRSNQLSYEGKYLRLFFYKFEIYPTAYWYT